MANPASEPYLIGGHFEWLEQVGEVELIGGFAEVVIDAAVKTAADTTCYQVFLTSYDPVLLFVQNRTPQGFEVHALSVRDRRPPRAASCAYRLLARRASQAHQNPSKLPQVRD